MESANWLAVCATGTTVVSQSDCRIPNVPEKVSSLPMQGTLYHLKRGKSALRDLWHLVCRSCCVIKHSALPRVISAT